MQYLYCGIEEQYMVLPLSHCGLITNTTLKLLHKIQYSVYKENNQTAFLTLL